MEAYVHHVQYYETDRMGITHHSNYIRWMEEARIDFLSQYGWPYEKLEEAGIFIPVLAVEGHFHKSTTFSDAITIRVRVESFNGIRLRLAYEMTTDGAKRPLFTGSSEHCFLNAKGRPIRLNKDYPAFYEQMRQISEECHS